MKILEEECKIVLELCDLATKTYGLKTHPNVFMLAKKIENELKKNPEVKNKE